jgi:hypothetical protein
MPRSRFCSNTTIQPTCLWKRADLYIARGWSETAVAIVSFDTCRLFADFAYDTAPAPVESYPDTRMPLNSTRNFLQTDEGQLAQYRSRKSRRLHVAVHAVEPQSKRMSEVDRDRFQAEVLACMLMRKRMAFRGSLALRIDLSTSSKNPPQAHTIAKNILDLLAARRPNVKGREACVLYKDDKQIQALSVSCRHGETQPLTMLEARPMSAMLKDLETATEASRQLELSDPSRRYEDDRNDDWVKSLKDNIKNEEALRIRLGDTTYDAFTKFYRRHAQRALLSRSTVNVSVLHWMCGQSEVASGIFAPDAWVELIRSHGVRLEVGELPIAKGTGDAFRARIASAIADFQTKWNWLLDPLEIAVALEVVVRPSPGTPRGVLHDLDNIVRDYLLPQVVPAFDTVSDQRWTIDFEDLRQTAPELAAAWGANPLPPKGTRSGVTRYEVWRLPPSSESGPGFVSAALVADMDARGGLMEQMDDLVEEWSTMLSRKRP